MLLWQFALYLLENFWRIDGISISYLCNIN